MRNEAASQIEAVRNRIDEQLSRAGDLPKENADKIYDSIIKLNQKFSWAADLVAIARERKNDSMEQ